MNKNKNKTEELLERMLKESRNGLITVKTMYEVENYLNDLKEAEKVKEEANEEMTKVLIRPIGTSPIKPNFELIKNIHDRMKKFVLKEDGIWLRWAGTFPHLFFEEDKMQ